MCPWNEGKKFRLVRRLGVAGPTQKSLWSSLHFLWPAILTKSKACLIKRVYSIYLILKRGNLKVIQIWGMIPEGRNTNFTLNGPKKKQTKLKVCPDAYGCQPVHGANNFQCSSLTRHQSGNDHINNSHKYHQTKKISWDCCASCSREGEHSIEGSSKNSFCHGKRGNSWLEIQCPDWLSG